MIWALKESIEKGRKFIPYGRLLSEIFYQGGILKALKMSDTVADDHMGTVVGKYINANTLKSMYLVKEVEKREADLKESMIVSDLMTDFPPISKEDNPEVLAAYVITHYERTGEIINLSSILDTMAGAPLRIANKKRKSKKMTSEAAEVEVFEPKPKKAKKEKIASQVNIAEPALPAIQEEVFDLEPVKILEKRTRGGSSEVASSQPISIVQKKRRTIKKMRVSDCKIQ